LIGECKIINIGRERERDKLIHKGIIRNKGKYSIGRQISFTEFCRVVRGFINKSAVFDLHQFGRFTKICSYIF